MCKYPPRLHLVFRGPTGPTSTKFSEPTCHSLTRPRSEIFDRQKVITLVEESAVRVASHVFLETSEEIREVSRKRQDKLTAF